MIEIKNLSIAYGENLVVDNVSFCGKQGEIIGIVGESGSGKSTMLKSILGLLGKNGRIVSGEILCNGENLACASKKRMSRIRGGEVGMIFQHPELSLDPLCTIGASFYESIRVHRPITKKEARQQGRELLEALKFQDPEVVLDAYPFELSGGMCQRAAAAIAIANRPGILLADEPTSALDVTVQKQVIDTLLDLRDTFHTTMILVSHNMGVIAAMADQVGVMRKGKMVEWGEKEQVLHHPEHPYTKALIGAIPKMDGKLPEVMEEISYV